MNTISKFSTALLVLSFTAFAASAQNDNAPQMQRDDAPQIQKDENIVIHKNGRTNEKLTIVVDGDKVTVNGKPLADFQDDNVKIITDGDGDDMMAMNDDGMAPMPPMPPHGGAMSFITRDDDMPSNKAFLGVMSDKADGGVMVTDVTKGSAAEKAGLQKNDVITKLGNAAIATPGDLYKEVGKYNAGDKVDITYLRSGKSQTTSATLDKNENNPKMMLNRTYNFKMPKDFNRDFSFAWDNKPRMGIEVQETENGNGVKITDINDDDAPAAKAGLKEDDIITSINGKAVKSVDDVKSVLKDVKEGDSVSVQYLRDGKSQTTQVKFPKELKSTDL